MRSKAATTTRRVLLADHGGHGFTYELALDLGRTQGAITYAYSACNTAPHGALITTDEVVVEPVGDGWVFEKYRLWLRVKSEIRLGVAYSKVVRRTRPTVIVAANMPVLSLLLIWTAGLLLRSKRVLWLQDVQSGLLGSSDGGGAVVRILGFLETLCVRLSSRTIAISEEIAARARRMGGREAEVSVLRNWPPLAALPLRPRQNAWSAEHALDDTVVLLYAGTLARKHNPEMLVSLARAVRDHAAKVVVVTEGEGAEVLADALGSDPDLPLLVLPYQPFELMPEMLATADVLLALLQASASPFSVPSKTLSYLCAGRPVVASMPRTNLAARIIVDEAGAGRVVDSGDAAAFVAAVLALAADSEERLRLGSSARAYAERAFDPASIRTAFLDAAGLPCRFST